MKKIILLVFLAILFILGCQPAKQEKSGFYIELIDGAGFISYGKTLLEGEPFRIGLKLINYDEEEKRGNICVYDNMNDYYGGIQKECKQFYVAASSKTEKGEIPAITKIYFPSQGYYSYVNLPTDFSPEIYIETEYMQQSTFSSTLSYPIPETETFSFSDKFISLSIEKSVHLSESGYEIFLRINLRKKGNISVEANNQKGKILFSLEAIPLVFNCQTQKQQFSKATMLDIEKENFISCSTLTSSKEQEALPLVVMLQYKAKEVKKIKINVKKRG